MWSDFLVFCIAVVSHWQGYITGGAVTALVAVVERLSDWKMSKRAYATVFLGVFLFVSFFLTWRDEYKNAQGVSTLQSQLREKEKQIEQFRDKPANVQVTVPPPVVNIPSQMAYLASTDIGIVVPEYRMGGHFAVNALCKNISPSTVAEDAACIRSLRVVSTILNPTNNPIVPTEVQDKTYRQFLGDIASLKDVDRRTYGPQEGFFATVSSPAIDEELDKAFRSGSKTILYAGHYEWRDGMGKHANEVCAWLQIYPGLFNGPGLLASNPVITWNYCTHHNGLKR